MKCHLIIRVWRSSLILMNDDDVDDVMMMTMTTMMTMKIPLLIIMQGWERLIDIDGSNSYPTRALLQQCRFKTALHLNTNTNTNIQPAHYYSSVDLKNLFINTTISIPTPISIPIPIPISIPISNPRITAAVWI